MWTDALSPSEYVQARWRKLSPEAKRILRLDIEKRRQRTVTIWLMQYFERKQMEKGHAKI